MATPIFVKGKPINLKSDPRFDENWVKDRIKEDTSILGLGSLEIKSIERVQKGGILDLLLVDEDEDKWFEVEVQLGTTDPSHIIRTIEYWDYEQRHRPNHKHCAVLVAEDVTARFLNVMALFNRQIPIMAIQMKAIELQGQVMLHFTRVLDTEETEEEDETTLENTVTLADWQKKTSETVMKVVQGCLSILHELDAGISEVYRQFRIGMTVGGKPNRFVILYPKKQYVTVHARPKEREEWADRLTEAGIDVISTGTKIVRFRLTESSLVKNRDLLKQLFTEAYEEYKA